MDDDGGGFIMHKDESQLSVFSFYHNILLILATKVCTIVLFEIPIGHFWKLCAETKYSSSGSHNFSEPFK